MSTKPIDVAHSSEGRLRLRLPWLRGKRLESETVADLLTEIDGVIEVAVRPMTGSVLCLYDPDETGSERIINAVRALADSGAGREPEPTPLPPTDARSTVARALEGSVRQVNQDVLNATDGRLDLATTAAIAFVGIGAAELLFSRKVPAPPWFNLAWWALQTFTAFEREGNGQANMPAD